MFSRTMINELIKKQITTQAELEKTKQELDIANKTIKELENKNATVEIKVAAIQTTLKSITK